MWTQYRINYVAQSTIWSWCKSNYPYPDTSEPSESSSPGTTVQALIGAVHHFTGDSLWEEDYYGDSDWRSLLADVDTAADASYPSVAMAGTSLRRHTLLVFGTSGQSAVR
jgi:hypothetical protein